MANPFGFTKASDISALFKAGNDTNLTKDQGYLAYQAELDKQRKIAQLKAQAQAADAQVQKDTVANQNLLEQVKRFGPAAVADTAKSFVEAPINLVKTDVINPAVTEIARARGNPFEIQAAQQAQNEQLQHAPQDILGTAAFAIPYGKIAERLGLTSKTAELAQKYLKTPSPAPVAEAPSTGVGNVVSDAIGQGSAVGKNVGGEISSIGAESGALRTSGSSLRTEFAAVEKGIVDELPKAQYKTVNFAQEAEKAINLIKTNPQKAVDIAFGNVRGESNVQEVAIRKLVEKEALQNNDVNTLGRLAESSSNVETSKSAQRLGAEGYFRNNESPVAAMKDIISARKASRLPGIPKGLTNAEQAKITGLYKDMDAKKALIDGTPNGSPERLAYGMARVQYDNYVNAKVLAARAKNPQELSIVEKGLNKTIAPVAGTAKSLKAALDVSRIFRQDWKLLFSHPGIWSRNSAKSFRDAVRQFGGKEVLDATKAEIISRENAPLYEAIQKASKIDLFPLHEEAFPTSLPGKVPGFGRVFKASEAAFEAGQWRERAELVDLYKGIFEARGKDLTDKKFLSQFGEMVGDLTSRGKLKNQGRADLYNKLFFAPRNLKANVKFLTSGGFSELDPSIRAVYAKSLLKTVAGTAVILATMDHYIPGSVDFDPRSSNFGKIKIGNTRFDVTGGMSSLLTLAARTVPTPHNGKWSNYYKSSSNNQITDLRNPGATGQNGWDVLVNFATGKASPAASTLINILSGETFVGDKPTVASEAKNLFLPLPIANYEELKKDPNSANDVLGVIADALGVGTNTYAAQKDFAHTDTKQVNGFKSKVSEEQFVKASQNYQDEFTSWLNRVQKDAGFKNLNDDNQAKVITQKKQALLKEVMKRYGYTYKAQKDEQSNKQIKRVINL